MKLKLQDLPETYHDLPAIKSLLSYINDRTPGGHFVNALLRNDLKGVFYNADSENSELVRDYVRFLYNYAPEKCWGSKDKFDAWVDGENTNTDEIL